MPDDKDLLADYNARRDFTRTREPAGTLEHGNGNAFYVQKHAASRLHFDLRLEMDGVLKSWAVTRGPSSDPADKRLAVRTEDHPLSYGDFEGTIPRGEYGAGTVMLWDRGTWAPVRGSKAELSTGKLHFILQGERMKGEWLLVRMRGKQGGKRENWLLQKREDAHAGGSDQLVGRHLSSIKTGRTMAAIAADDDGAETSHGDHPWSMPDTVSEEDGSLPMFRKPQLATLADAVPAGNHWLHEIKYDGYRCQLAVAGKRVRIHTRSGKDWTERFTDIAEAVAALNLPVALIDGEIVKADSDGNPDFSALQQALKQGEQGFTLFAFDLLVSGKDDLTALSTLERKHRLDALIPPDHPTIRVADHIIGAGERLLDMLCDAGQEGIICKRFDTPYRHGRSTDWLKVKCTKRQEFVVVGWRESNSKGRAFASILLAQYEDDRLVYKGRVGTGFGEQEMASLSRRFQQLARKSPAVDVPKADARDAHWLTPRLVVEIAFSQFTSDGRVRHGSYVGLRSDKLAREVSSETATSVEQLPETVQDVRISSRDRIVFPKTGATKGDVADYYQAISALMLPWISRRPVSLVRCPQGRSKRCFFQRHDPGSFGDAVKSVPVTEKDGEVDDYLYVDSAAGILACVQMGTIEFHGWGSCTEALEQPDRLVFDLDPDAGLDFAAVRKAAGYIRQQLDAMGLVSFAMLSGGKGVHVVIPLTPQAEWPVVKDFASRFAKALALSHPGRYTASMSKKKRKGRIFIDWLRNQRGATSVLPYSVRAREGAPVAVPVSWEELGDIPVPGRFRIEDVETLIERGASADLRHWGVIRQVLPDL